VAVALRSCEALVTPLLDTKTIAVWIIQIVLQIFPQALRKIAVLFSAGRVPIFIVLQHFFVREWRLDLTQVYH
jgi:hypothetical protein